MFEIINNMTENFIFALFICSYLGIKEKRNIYIFITVILNTIVSTILTSLNIIGLTQTFIIQFIFCSSLYLIRHKLYLHDIAVSLFCNILLLMSGYFATIFTSFIANTSPMESFSNNTLYLTIVFLSRTIFMLLCYITYKKRFIPTHSLKDKKVHVIFVFEVLLVMVMVFYFVNTVISLEYNFMSNVIYLCFIALFSTFYVLVNEYIKVKNNLYEQEINVQKEKYIKENLNNLQRIKDDISNKEHRINYILQLTEYDIENKDYEQAKKRLHHIKELMYKIEPAIQTGNEIFDFMINMEVKQMYVDDKRIKICSFISSNNAYNQYDIWNPIVEILHIISTNTDFVELYLSELDNQILSVKIMYTYTIENKEEVLMKLKEVNDCILHIHEFDHMLIIKYRKKLNESY